MLGACAWIFACAWLYGPVLTKLAQDWRADASYSHGFLVAPIAMLLAWRQRGRIRRTAPEPSVAGLLVVGGSLALYATGVLGAELFLTRLSLIGLLAGTIVFVLGWPLLRAVSFPLVFLIFMIPLPAIVFDRVAVSLQLIASTLGEYMLQAAHVPVLRDGNILRLANATLEVNDACSGIRSLIALTAVAALTGYVFEPVVWRRLVVLVAAVPFAVMLNGVRIALTGFAADRFGAGAAQGTVHDASGGLVFLLALAAIGAVQRISRSRHMATAKLEPREPEASASKMRTA
jgi:exosortase